MKNILILFFLLTSLTAFAQKKMENKFLTWDNFTNGFGKEMVASENVFNNMVKNGLKDNALTKMDFTFVSDKKENLQKLAEFLKKHYPYTIKAVKKSGKIWEINGETNEMPLTADNLLYWGLDMYKRGYEFDAKIDAYGGFLDAKNQKFPVIEPKKADFYFDKALECHKNEDLSGALFNWTLCLQCDPKNADAYYSNGVVKADLFTWKAALRDYDKAIELDPQFVDALFNRGALKDVQADYKGAIADYETLLKIDKLEKIDVEQAYFSLGNTYFNLKEKKQACENWQKAVENGLEEAKNSIKQHCK